MNERDCKHGRLARSCNECDLEEQLAIAQAENLRIYPLARRCLWLAYVWNDHNFDYAHLEARKEAMKAGITDLDEANEWLLQKPRAALDALIAEAKRPLELDAQQAREIVADLMQRLVLVNNQLTEANAKIAELQAKLKGAEPVAWMFQHEETGRTMCVDVVQVENGFEQNNPRLQKIAPLFTAPPQVEAAVEDFRRRAVEVCSNLWDMSGDGCAKAIAALPAFEVTRMAQGE